MRPYLDTVFREELGIEGPDRERCVDWILDRIVREEFERILAETSAEWSVWRQDDNGSQFEIARNVSATEAGRRIAQLESTGHKQHYWLARTR